MPIARVSGYERPTSLAMRTWERVEGISTGCNTGTLVCMHNLAPVKHHSAKARLGDSCVWRNIVKPERGSNADACPVHVRYKSDACPVRLVGNADEDWRGSLVSDLSWVDPSNLTAMFERSHSCACTRAFNATASSCATRLSAHRGNDDVHTRDTRRLAE